MDNNGQNYQANYNQQYMPDSNSYGQYNQYQMYENNQYMYPQGMNGNPYMQNVAYQNNSNVVEKKRGIITLSLLLGVIGSVVMLIGLMLPIIDFSHFHQDVDIQYNLFKVGKNVGLISPMWNVIPYAILGGIVLMIILSFVRIPILKILPAVLILCMFVLMLADMGNLAQWATDIMNKFDIVLEVDITTKEIFKSLMPGIYIMISGLLIGLVSCFVKIKGE